ncbi:MAG: Eco57I restriction-modification methylase domain-containing protein [Ruminococcus sp.]|nr:Eco57I restriction-modification methylase domain-containing protein [Ruminococcus sp.]
METDTIENDIRSIDIRLLEILLADRSTNKNIVWATNDYNKLGEGYAPECEIKAEQITGPNAGIIRPRVAKAKDKQSGRTRDKAEVFTPCRICNAQNDLIDKQWFGRENVFNIAADKKFKAVDGRIVFPEKPERKWQDYVRAKRMEITCGEAPYLVSRYDAVSGRTINDIHMRIGLLDRKLRVVDENTDNEADWFAWVKKAYQSIYGYEYQGDSLLLARENLLFTLTDHCRYKWGRLPAAKEYIQIAYIISWNIWQMDGRSFTAPYSEAVSCVIRDWTGKKYVVFKDLLEKGGNMTFDAIAGNPPYQIMDGGNGASASPVYQHFVYQAMKISNRYVSMIMPAKWYSGGKGLDDFRSAMLSDRRLKIIVDHTNSLDVFPSVDIAGGVCYFLWDSQHNDKCLFRNISSGTVSETKKYLDEFSTLIRYPLADSIIHKIVSLKESYMSTMVSSRKPFGLTTNVRPTAEGELTLRYSGGRGAYRRSDISVGNDIVDKWKVMISYLSAEHAGQPDKNGMFRVLSTTEILPPATICTETYLIAGSFDTENEAINLYNYLKTKFVRFLIMQVAVSQHITRACFSFVPIQDLSKAWDDSSLYEKYHLTKEEILFIESKIRSMD